MEKEPYQSPVIASFAIVKTKKAERLVGILERWRITENGEKQTEILLINTTVSGMRKIKTKLTNSKGIDIVLENFLSSLLKKHPTNPIKKYRSCVKRADGKE